MQAIFAVITFLGYVLTLTLLPVVLLTKKRQTVSTVAWAMAIVMMPYMGAILFLLFGINRVKRRVVGRRAAVQDISRVLPELTGHQVPVESLNRLQQDL